MTHVCDNPQCQYHVDLPIQHDAREARVVSVINFHSQLVTRHHYQKLDYTGYLYFCGACHNAIQMFAGAGK